MDTLSCSILQTSELKPETLSHLPEASQFVQCRNWDLVLVTVAKMCNATIVCVYIVYISGLISERTSELKCLTQFYIPF